MLTAGILSISAGHAPRKMFDARGRLKKLSELDHDEAAAIMAYQLTEWSQPMMKHES